MASKKPLVDIGIACSGFQSHSWWAKLWGITHQEIQKGLFEIGKIFAISSAVPDHAKNHGVGVPVVFGSVEEKRRNERTDANRVAIVGAKAAGGALENTFWDSGADFLLFLDDDTVPPENFISHLISLKRQFVAGLYFMAREPFNPIAYIRNPDGLYSAFYNYPPGALVQVDSVGMGCTLIHRSVFEAIIDAYEVYQRPNGSLFPVRKHSIYNEREPKRADPYVKNGYYHMPIKKVEPDDNRAWPFFVLEYGRTEDHHFCELASSVGFRPWLDTTIVCSHIKPHGFGRREYLEHLPKEMRHEGA